MCCVFGRYCTRLKLDIIKTNQIATACRLAVSEANPNKTSCSKTLGFSSFSTNLLDRHVLCLWQALYQAETGHYKNQPDCRGL